MVLDLYQRNFYAFPATFFLPFFLSSCSQFSYKGPLQGQLKDLEYFIGIWNCDAHSEKTYEGETKKGHDPEGRVIFTKDLKGNWIKGDYIAAPI